MLLRKKRKQCSSVEELFIDCYTAYRRKCDFPKFSEVPYKKVARHQHQKIYFTMFKYLARKVCLANKARCLKNRYPTECSNSGNFQNLQKASWNSTWVSANEAFHCNSPRPGKVALKKQVNVIIERLLHAPHRPKTLLDTKKLLLCFEFWNFLQLPCIYAGPTSKFNTTNWKRTFNSLLHLRPNTIIAKQRSFWIAQ